MGVGAGVGVGMGVGIGVQQQQQHSLTRSLWLAGARGEGERCGRREKWSESFSRAACNLQVG